MPQKILFLTLKTFSLTGGIEKVCRCLAMVLTSIASKEQQVRMISLCDDCADVQEKYFPRQYFKGFNNNKLKFSIIALRQALKSDILILSHINLLAIAFLAKKIRPEKRIILFAHGIEVWRPIRTWKRRFIQRHVEIWAVSDYTSEQMQNLHHITKSHIEILNNCLDPFITIPSSFDKPKGLLKRYQLNIDQPVLFTLTRLSSSELYKGYDLVIKAIPKLLEQFPTLTYLIAGKADQLEKKRIDTLIADLNLEKHVILVGFLPDEELTDHFLLADVFVMPSRKEGFGIVFIEAAACGCSVIAGNQDGSVDALLNGDLGQLIDPTDQTAITEAIVKSLKQPKTPESAAKIQKLCLQHFNFENYQKKVVQLLDNRISD